MKLLEEQLSLNLVTMKVCLTDWGHSSSSSWWTNISNGWFLRKITQWKITDLLAGIPKWPAQNSWAVCVPEPKRVKVFCGNWNNFCICLLSGAKCNGCCSPLLTGYIILPSECIKYMQRTYWIKTKQKKSEPINSNTYPTSSKLPWGDSGQGGHCWARFIGQWSREGTCDWWDGNRKGGGW